MKMKNKIYSILMVTVFTASTMFASFPVKKSNNTTVVNEQVVLNKKSIDQKVVTQVSTLDKTSLDNAVKAKSASDGDMIILLLLWFFLGGLAAHRWYAGKPVGWNILFILTGGGCGVWAIVDLINIITGKFSA